MKTGEEKAAAEAPDREEATGRTRRRGYRRELPRELYRFFLRTAGAGELPSLHKFAVSAGLTLEEIAAFRSHRQFDRAVRACSEIRRDWLIDGGLSKRLDSSLVRFLLSAEFGMGERAEEEDDRLSVTMTVVK